MANLPASQLLDYKGAFASGETPPDPISFSFCINFPVVNMNKIAFVAGKPILKKYYVSSVFHKSQTGGIDYDYMDTINYKKIIENSNFYYGKYYNYTIDPAVLYDVLQSNVTYLSSHNHIIQVDGTVYFRSIYAPRCSNPLQTSAYRVDYTVSLKRENI